MNVRSAIVALLLAPAVALAAPPGDAPKGGTAPGGESKDPPAVDRMTPDAAAKIPDQEKLRISVQKLQEIKKDVDKVTDYSDQARKKKDLGKLNDLIVLLTQMMDLQKMARLSDEGLRDAVKNKDSATAATHFSRIWIASRKVRKMGLDADRLLGQVAYLIDGQTSVEAQEAIGLTVRDVTRRAAKPPLAAAPPIVRPGDASTFR